LTLGLIASSAGTHDMVGMVDTSGQLPSCSPTRHRLFP